MTDEQTGVVFVAGTFDTKANELNYMAEHLVTMGLNARTVDLSTSGAQSVTDVKATEVAAHHPDGAEAVFTGDRGTAVEQMAIAFTLWMTSVSSDVAGVISAAGSGGTALATPAMRSLPIGVPKVMISTVASGDVGPYVGPSDIMMMYSVTDVQGLNAISRKVLGNGAAALVGMVRNAPEDVTNVYKKPGLGLMMFGVTTQAVQAISALVEDQFEPFVFHATGIGGQSMEKLVDNGFLSAVVDLTTTEVADMIVGGVMAATEDRFGAIIRQKAPFIGSVGALDMVNFGAFEAVPLRYTDRLFYKHNPQVTLMRTTAEENAKIGMWIAAHLNQMEGPVRFILPEGGISALDAPEMPFWDPVANKALFDAIESTFKRSDSRKMIRSKHHINAPEFAQLCADALREIV
ncbi:MAG: Tm-1-like ATP-binding domain-containing protein [Rhodospirillales bacterium]